MSPFDEARYARLLEGLEVAERKLSELERTWRMDAEFFQRRHLAIEAKLSATHCGTVAGVASVADGNHFSISGSFVEEGVPYYRGQDVVGHFFIEQATPNRITREAFEQSYMQRSHLKQGDVLLSIIGTVGETSLVKTNQEATCSCKLAILRPKDIEPAYLATYLSSGIGRALTERWKRGAVQTGLLLEDMDQLQVPRFGKVFEGKIAAVVSDAYDAQSASVKAIDEAETSLLHALGLENWQAPEPLSYIRSSQDAFTAGRLDAEFFSSRVRDMFVWLGRDGLTIQDVAPARKERFTPADSGDFHYIEIGGLGAEGTAQAERLSQREAPSRATQYVRAGDVITSTVRPIRRLSAAIDDSQDGYVCSSGFVVLQPCAIRSDVLLTYLRLPPICALMDLHTSASMYPAISEADLLALPIPKIPEATQEATEKSVLAARQAKQRATQLLSAAKRAVEIAIEDSEAAALVWLETIAASAPPCDDIAHDLQTNPASQSATPVLARQARRSAGGIGPPAHPHLDQREGFRVKPTPHLGQQHHPLADLHKRVSDFAFIQGEKPLRLDPENPANLAATQLLADLHDALKDAGYSGHALERYLVRILFCLFADDTGIFEPQLFTSYIKTRTREDGSDLGPLLAELFEVLDTDDNQRMRNLNEDLASFPYVNGGLFSERLRSVSFNRQLRDALLKCCNFLWAKISPAVFGSLFQGVMDDTARRQIGAHYTSERDIMKVLRGLFLDDFSTKLEAALSDRSTRKLERLRDFQKELRHLRVFDPACGCGNLLIIAYRELRRLETQALLAIVKATRHEWEGTQLHQNVRELVQVDVDQFYGIEILEWPGRIAEVGLWLTDHQCNLELAEALGQSVRRLPLRATPTILVDNALRVDWSAFLPPGDEVLLLSNPPFAGKYLMSAQQDADMEHVCGHIQHHGLLDYVSAWYVKAANYVADTRIRAAFVSTNSITQGEQVGVLWRHLFRVHHLKIHFAHRTFSWTSEAKGKAHVHVVIIGFGAFDVEKKAVYDYDGGTQATITEARNISPYLVEGIDNAILSRSDAICEVSPIVFGNMANDGGHLLLSAADKAAFVAAEPGAAKFLRRFLGADEFINGIERWCLWLVGAAPAELRALPLLMKRVEGVKSHRVASQRPATQKLADTPTLFGEIRQPTGTYILVPRHSSERRRYIPMGFLDPKTIVGDANLCIPNAKLYHFGVLSSAMHMAWVRQVCGRLKSDYRYSNKLVYNNFPWPAVTGQTKEIAAVEKAAQAVIDARNEFPASTLADLYDPLTMPGSLTKAHAALDRAVDRCYRPEQFPGDRARFEHLFTLYERLVAPLVAAAAVKPKRGRAAKPNQ